MPVKYITTKTARLYESATSKKWNMILIFGDEVETTGQSDNGRVLATFRGREGYIAENQLGYNPSLELYYIDVGQGDATFVVTPNRKKILIDGGLGYRAYGFLVWKYRLDEDGNDIDIDLLVLSHADGDHIQGLVPIIQHPKIKVKKILHNGIATFEKNRFRTPLGDLDATEKYLITRHNSLDDLNGLPLDDQFRLWYDAIKAENSPYQAVDSSTGRIDIGDSGISMDIVGPCCDMYGNKKTYRWFNDPGKTINGHSVIFRLTYGGVTALFPGDINGKSSEYLLQTLGTEPFNAHVFKAPHHGSDDYHKPFLDAVNPQISIISSGDVPAHGHPRASFIGAIGRASRSEEPLVFSTKISTAFVEDSRGKKAVTDDDTLECLNLAEPNADKAAYRCYKKVLNGMINVRTDGENIFAARRVTASYGWESYGPIKPA